MMASPASYLLAYRLLLGLALGSWTGPQLLAQTAPPTMLARFRIRMTYRDPYLALPPPRSTAAVAPAPEAAQAADRRPVQMRRLQVDWRLSPEHQALLQAKWAWAYGQPTIPGYRVQIFSGTRREAANAALLDFAERFPDERVYLVSEPPYFKVRAGDFSTRLGAWGLYSRIQALQSGAFVVPDQIRK